MEQKKKHRKVLRTVFTKGANELDQLLKARTGDGELRPVQVSWKLLQHKQKEMKLVDGEIYEALLAEDVSEEDLLKEIETCDGYERTFTDLKLRYDNLLESRMTVEEDLRSVASGSSEVNSTADVVHKRKLKLPIIEFKKFDGNIRDWLPFWAQFKKIHEDANIDLGDKIEYLIQATVSGSRARRLVESFPAMGENYEKIITGMKSRFGREDLQIEVYVRELLRLIISNATSKNKLDISVLYDQIETQLRALETLGITSDKCSAMLFPLIESCLPEDLLRVWQRVPQKVQTETDPNDSVLENRLQSLMCFLRIEVANEQRISLAAEGLGLCSSSTKAQDYTESKKPSKQIEATVATAASLINSDVAKCVFCESSHDSEACFKAQKLTLECKREIMTEKKACFRCLKRNHQSKRCRVRLKCIVCGRSHVVLMCPELPVHKQGTNVPLNTSDVATEEHTLFVNNASGYVFLETLRVKISSQSGSHEIRVLIDSGSQRSYVLKSTARKLGYKLKRKERIAHCLFGGTTQELEHECYDARLSHAEYSCTFEVLDQSTICKDISPVFYGPWTEELKRLNVQLSDTGTTGPIELLIGADVSGKLYTGKRHILPCGLVAVETLLGWTLSGRIPLDKPDTSTAMTVFSLLVKDASITDLWKLDVLGITEPSEKRSRDEMACAAKELFLQTIKINEEGRYEIGLPWLEGHPPLPNNYCIGRKRLDTTVKKLKGNGLFESYDMIFKEWLLENILEEVSLGDIKGHYLPHRPVIKEESLTTKIRPVFDASARENDRPSLNHCLEKGVNLIELIPTILLRFRTHRIGVISDIRKAFLQISLHQADRDFLRFLWLDENGHEKVYRHRRVVFGITSSPFLLGATIEYHLSEKLKECELHGSPYSLETVLKLSKSFYVDNCVASVPDEDTLGRFIRESSMLMAEAKFDLRGWEYTQAAGHETTGMSVLGLIWNSGGDTLTINKDCFKTVEDIQDKTVTKRLILSMTQRVFDPIGFTSPVTLSPKLLLQRTWEQQLGWDTRVDAEIEKAFRDWVNELRYLFIIEIPRWICAGITEAEKWSLHTFCDASIYAYAAVVFLRVEQGSKISVYLLAAKARVAPLKGMTIIHRYFLDSTERRMDPICVEPSS